ncbi:MAG: type II toxin-antitoxin system VapC family toxin [Candidatus Brocadia sp.]|nr:MAG: type II toxin-antitoxin system VapC family toxin [Candidatus Brocadia sp.]
MKIFVPDASIILKWVLEDEENNRDEAMVLLRGWVAQEHEFVVPSLWLCEVGNVLGLKRPKDAEKLLKILLEYEFTEMKITKDVTSIAFALMKEYRGVTFCDTIYHAVAIRNKGTMVTADKTYYTMAKDKGSILLL